MRTAYLIEPEDMARLRKILDHLYLWMPKLVSKDIGVILSRAIEIELPDKAPDGPMQCRTVTRISVSS